MKTNDEFAEWANVHDFLYGTPRSPWTDAFAREGTSFWTSTSRAQEKSNEVILRAVSIFLLPPSWRELKRRLAWRGTDGKETIRRRLVNARDEIRNLINYDYYVVNREVNESLELLDPSSKPNGPKPPV